LFVKDWDMTTIKHILFPIDFSERCCRAVPFVESIARKFGAKITLISVAHPSYYGAAESGGVVVIDEAEVLSDIKARLSGALLHEFGDLEVERVAELGDPATAIAEFVHTNGVDLVMMPTHGYGRFRSLLLGSVTAKVLHDVECAVWTAAHVAEYPVRGHIGCKSVLCAVDGTPKSVPLMHWAAQYAKDLGATLRLVHVVQRDEARLHIAQDATLEEAARRETREQIERLKTSAGVVAPLCVAMGNIADGVREEAKRHGADLVVIGRGILHETLGRLRTHAYGIIRHAPCPVLSV
jgi:nucleotide-binding universal stress UspA family protein